MGELSDLCTFNNLVDLLPPQIDQERDLLQTQHYSALALLVSSDLFLVGKHFALLAVIDLRHHNRIPPLWLLHLLLFTLPLAQDPHILFDVFVIV